LAAQGLMAHATTPFVVHDIRIEGLQRVEPGTVFAYLPIKQGDTFSGDRASEAIRALYATGFFNDVQIATEGSIVIVHVVERPAIGSIDFSGLREFDNDNPAKALRAVGLSQRRYYDKALAEKAEQELRRQYLTLGCYAAGVKSTITPIGPLKLGLGFPLTKHSGDQYQKFQIQIGTAF
jgi:outer membrane protein insertion porin family